MQLSYNELFLEILSVIKYANKEQFIREFEQMNKLEAIEKSIKKMPKQLFHSIMKHGSTPEDVMKQIKPATYQKELRQVSTDALADFIKHMQPVLTIKQNEEIAFILQKAQTTENIL